MNDAYRTSLEGRAQRYREGKPRTATSTVGAVANLQKKDRTTVITMYDLEEELRLENRRRLVAEKALLESEEERHLLERLLKENTPAPRPTVLDTDVDV